MSNSYRSHRRQKKSGAGRLGLAGALTGVVAIAAVAAGIVVLRPDGEDPAQPALSSQNDTGTVAGGAPASAPSPKTGQVLSLTTPEGYGYGLAAVKAGVDDHPFKDSKPSPSGSGFAYADYVLTNNQRRPVLLDFPADLFMPASQVPGSAKDRCMPQPGIPDDMCTLPNKSQVIARIGTSKAPVKQDADTFIPAGASYLVRVATDLPVLDGLNAEDLKLYVWDARFTNDRKGVELAFP